jgi:hypothetical protein
MTFTRSWNGRPVWASNANHIPSIVATETTSCVLPPTLPR